jgi:plasmid stability protein
MAQLIVRRIADDVKERLKARAKRHGRSLEAEVRAILVEAAKTRSKPRKKQEKGFGRSMAELFKGIGLTEEERRQLDQSIEEARRSNPIRFAGFDE